MAEKLSDWYPSQEQLKDPSSLERAFRRVLQLHYAQRDSVDGLHEKVASLPKIAGTSASQVPQVNTAAVTNILGLPISPADTTQLADGTKLTFNKSTRTFSFQ